MKKNLLHLFFILFCSSVFANDTYFFVSGGNLIPTTESENTVQMKSEIISIVFEEEYYQVNVDFNFYNFDNDIELLVGFPFFEAGIQGHGKIFDFKCWTNNELADFSDMPLDRNFSNTNYKGEQLNNAYVRKVFFPKNTTTKTKVNYKSEYGKDTSNIIVKYLYGTGSSWKNKIDEITLIIENKLPYYSPTLLLMENKIISHDFKRIADNKWEAHFYNIEPSYTDCFTINCSRILNDSGPKLFSLETYSFSKYKSDSSSLFWYTKHQLRILRNTIYALHGYAFKSEDLRNLFDDWGQYWYPRYKVNPNFSESEFSESEKFNINLLVEEENKR